MLVTSHRQTQTIPIIFVRLSKHLLLFGVIHTPDGPLRRFGL